MTRDYDELGETEVRVMIKAMVGGGITREWFEDHVLTQKEAIAYDQIFWDDYCYETYWKPIVVDYCRRNDIKEVP